jgi:hypothetical protein
MVDSKSAQAQPGVPEIAASLVANGLLAGLFMACILLALTLGHMAENALRERARDLPATIVLRDGVSEESAAAVADRLRNKSPGLQADVIGRIAGRALLGIQEPWMQRLPDLELAELPVLIEVRHPGLLDKDFDATAFVKDLEMLPETDFVAFNATSLDRFAEFANTVRAYGSATVSGFAIICGAGTVMLTILLSLRRRYATPKGALLAAISLTAVTGLVGWIAATLVLNRLPSVESLPRVSLPAWAAALGLLAAVFTMTELMRVRRSRRRRKRIIS